MLNTASWSTIYWFSTRSRRCATGCLDKVGSSHTFFHAHFDEICLSGPSSRMHIECDVFICHLEHTKVREIAQSLHKELVKKAIEVDCRSFACLFLNILNWYWGVTGLVLPPVWAKEHALTIENHRRTNLEESGVAESSPYTFLSVTFRTRLNVELDICRTNAGSQ